MIKKMPPKLTKSKPLGLADATFEGQVERTIEKGKQLEELLLLCDLHGIDRTGDSIFQLALSLAHLVYPDNQPKTRGAKRKWSKRAGVFLVVEVMSEQEKAPGKRLSVLAVCRSLACKQPWKGFLRSDSVDPGEALRRKYYDYKKNQKGVKKYWAIRKVLEEKGRMDIWNKHVFLELGL